ncbi:MAG: methionyl-tRNA formyltransferase [Alistipes sp.]|nr:methionyl-tRNA formyltransferase [Candidatus Minthomonas equi]
MGTPEFATGPLKALIEGGYDIAAVVTVPDKPSGRGLKMNVSAVKNFILSENLQIPILQPEKLKDPEFIRTLEKINADIFVVVAFRILPKVIWSMPRLGTFNLHASLLPKYRGAAPINWAIINGEKETGVTTFLLDEDIDTGAILFQEKTPILPEDDLGTLYDRLMSIGSLLVPRTVDALFLGQTEAFPQDNSLQTCPAPKITRETMELDWCTSAPEIHNRIRGLSPYPATHTVLRQGDRCIDVKIFASRVETSDGQHEKPGKVISDGKKRILVDCASGRLEILELQTAGKKRLSTRDFLAGWHSGWDDVYFGASL